MDVLQELLKDTGDTQLTQPHSSDDDGDVHSITAADAIRVLNIFPIYAIYLYNPTVKPAAAAAVAT